jgi:hypothetical protein
LTPKAIIEKIIADGVRLVLTPKGNIKASGNEGAVNRWLPILREQKPGIVAALQSAESVVIEPAAPNARPVYWERGTDLTGHIVTWESPLFGLLSATVQEDLQDGVRVFHPLTERECVIPATWLRIERQASNGFWQMADKLKCLNCM